MVENRYRNTETKLVMSGFFNIYKMNKNKKDKTALKLIKNSKFFVLLKIGTVKQRDRSTTGNFLMHVAEGRHASSLSGAT